MLTPGSGDQHSPAYAPPTHVLDLAGFAKNAALPSDPQTIDRDNESKILNLPIRGGVKSTVPSDSGAAPEVAGVQASFRQGDQGRGTLVRLNRKGKDEGYEHQGSYNDPRSGWATLYSIVRIAREGDWA